MRQEPGREFIRIRGARQNNLRGFDLNLPTRRLIVVTGLSGSGKSSLAFDTLYAEGQRRYIETFSPYARQFFDRMDKPRVDAIEGIPPAIALEQRNSVRTTRSTVGTLTEICEHMKVLWPYLARLHCRQCGQPVAKEAPRDIWERVHLNRDGNGDDAEEVLITFDLPLSAKLSLDEQLTLVQRQGFQRLLVRGRIHRLDDLPREVAGESKTLTVIQDRVRTVDSNRVRFCEACEQAYHFGHGELAVHSKASPPAAGDEVRWDRTRPFSRHLHCAVCDLAYGEPTSALFSFNNPVGACPTCKGFGRVIGIDYDLTIPDRTKTLAGGAVRPWQTGTGAESQADLARAAKRAGIAMDVPFRDLPAEAQQWVIEGDPDYGEDHRWPKAWYGVKGYFRWLESKAYKMHVRVLLSRYRAYRPCPTCAGERFQPDTLLWRLPAAAWRNRSGPGADAFKTGDSLSLADFYALTVRQAAGVIEALAAREQRAPNDPIGLALSEVGARLRFLDDVGVGYLTIDRPTRTLSGGETQRVNLTTCLASRLVNTLFVLDEPSVGLHTRDTERLVRILKRLRDLGNTVVVVEHEAAVMRAADEIIDLGPGHGDAGGRLVVQAPFADLLRHPTSLTGAYLSGRATVPIPKRRSVKRASAMRSRRVRGGRAEATPPLELSDQAVAYRATPSGAGSPTLQIKDVTRHNLAGLSVDIPLGRLVCFSGVSGSGKTTLAAELIRLLRESLGGGSIGASLGTLGVREGEREENGGEEQTGEVEGRTDAALEGAEHLGAVLLVDQSPIGRTPRSNPAVYTGAFDFVRELFAQTELARERGLNGSAFSFNSRQGQCEQCRGAGFEKIEMQFLSDVFIRCPACDGRRYRPHLLDIRIEPANRETPDHVATGAAGVSIADALEWTIDDAIAFLSGFEITAARRATARLKIAQEVGLGYLRLGQPINTLSGGESQRLKLAGHLVESVALGSVGEETASARIPAVSKPTLFVFDEPTTGLHFEDVRILLQVFQRLVDAGHTVLIIEHNLEVLKCADWLIDLGPEAGADGGRVVVAGTPEDVAACEASHTGRALRATLGATTGLTAPAAGGLSGI